MSIHSAKNHLSEQWSTSAPEATKIRLSFLASALSDALGASCEFHPRGSFDLVTSMLANTNFNLPPGVWTDDTSMMLCLAQSLALHPDTFNECHQLQTYLRWQINGHLSAVDHCFDIGNTILRALYLYSSIQDESSQTILSKINRDLGKEVFSGNGSLMRLLPVPLIFWKSEEEAILDYARRSSSTTHPSPLCLEACEVWTMSLRFILQHTCLPSAKPISKMDLLHYIAHYPYSQQKLKNALTLDDDAELPIPTESSERESYYREYHPLLRIVASTSKSGLVVLPTATVLPSSGFVLHSLVAALYCFFSTDTFEQGAITAVNLGDDADTVATIYGGLAGVWYAATEDESTDDLFWSHRVRNWKHDLFREDLVGEVAQEVIDRFITNPRNAS